MYERLAVNFSDRFRILLQEEIFPDSEGGPMYEKYISSDQPPFEDLDLDVLPSEESQNFITLLTDEEAEVDGPTDADGASILISSNYHI